MDLTDDEKKELMDQILPEEEEENPDQVFETVYI